MTNDARGLSPAQQEKLGEAMAEVFAKAREAEKVERLARSLKRSEHNCGAH